jgi:hypothetical protein
VLEVASACHGELTTAYPSQNTYRVKFIISIHAGEGEEAMKMNLARPCVINPHDARFERPAVGLDDNSSRGRPPLTSRGGKEREKPETRRVDGIESIETTS